MRMLYATLLVRRLIKMRYLNFIISNYRAITGPLTINVDKKSLIPIIGINESGKTTILQAIFAFDYYNDELNENGRHLKDTTNLYRTTSPAATIEACIESTRQDFIRAMVDSEEDKVETLAKYLRKHPRFPLPIRIVRNLKSLTYSLPQFPLIPPELADLTAKAIIRQLPYILYFDDFRDKVDEKFEIVDAKKSNPTGWLAILERLFDQSEKGLSLFTLPEMDDRQRKGALAKVERNLNDTLTREWQHFRLEDTDALKIAVGFLPETLPNNSKRYYLTLDIVETDALKDRRFFHISDRSKGFFWFFNFVMKLEFNPKLVSQDDRNTIYLLDEPGSYLHASAQTRLCGKLRNLSDRNRVIYCTHSHYLLDPEKIPLSSIFIADKDGSRNVSLIPIYEFQGNVTETRSAFQPVLDALKIRPFVLEGLLGPVVITEGMIDYYCLELFKGSNQLKLLLSVGADSIKYYISLMITWSVTFKALWDNDEEGRKRYAESERLFGDDFARNRFYLLHKSPRQKSRIIQNLIEGTDLRMFREMLGLPSNTSFDKTIILLYYSRQKSEIIARVSDSTRDNFIKLFDLLSFSTT